MTEFLDDIDTFIERIERQLRGLAHGFMVCQSKLLHMMEADHKVFPKWKGRVSSALSSVCLMENPHEEKQGALLSRIVANVEKLNDAVEELNDRLLEINKHNTDIAIISQMWTNYNRSVLVHLESTQTLADPM